MPRLYTADRQEVRATLGGQSSLQVLAACNEEVEGRNISSASIEEGATMTTLEVSCSKDDSVLGDSDGSRSAQHWGAV